MKKPFLIGERVYLRPLSLEDLNGNYINWLNDSEVNKNNSHHIFPYTREHAEDYIKTAYLTKDKLVLAVNLKDKDVHIGNISLQRIDLLNRNAEFAILFGEKEYWGKGYSKEAGHLIIRHGFSSLNLWRIYCGTFSDNIAMQKLAAHLGFKQEGLRREAFFKKDKFIDIIEYGILKPEYYDKFVNE
jgi:ribosomal-protein-alanine N-acetyltransferase